MISEERILRVLVEKGLLKEDQIPSVEQALSAAGWSQSKESPGARVEYLVHQGKISDEALHSILRELQPETYASDHEETGILLPADTQRQEPAPSTPSAAPS